MKPQIIRDIKIGLICGIAFSFLIVIPILDCWNNPKNVIARLNQEKQTEEYRRAVLHYLWK